LQNIQTCFAENYEIAQTWLLNQNLQLYYTYIPRM